MKTRFSTLDICAIISEIKENAIGLRLANIYDVDNKTYLLKLIKPDYKKILLIESGIRMHLSEFEWPKNNFPSGFSMKMRKHLRGRRLTSIQQLGVDRIVDLQFGSNEASFHIIIELYDRGNIALTDCNYVILNLLRYRKQLVTNNSSEENTDVRIAVHEKYPISSARPQENLISEKRLADLLIASKKESLLKRVLNSQLPYGISTIEHCIILAGFSANCKLGVDFNVETDSSKLHKFLENGENMLRQAQTSPCQGFLIQKKQIRADGKEMMTNIEFQPFLFEQHKNQPYIQCTTFNQAVDDFFSALESQRYDSKVIQREKAILKKLENVRKDHETRIRDLRGEQDEDFLKATLIEANLSTVDKAIRVICAAIANQLDWKDIEDLVEDAKSQNDPVALKIRSLKLETNCFMMALTSAKVSIFRSFI